MSKKELGQYYSTNAHKLLKDFVCPPVVIEPFVGDGDLLRWAIKKGLKKYVAYDIDPPDSLKFKAIQRDTISNPPVYKNKFVLTNPPYLAKNKATDKAIFGSLDDLYKVFLSQILGIVQGGIIIIPINFLTSSDGSLRNLLFTKYKVHQINIFENPVFIDTTYSVCSIWFSDLGEYATDSVNVKFWWADLDEYDTLELKRQYNFLFGGEILDLHGTCKITRLTEQTNGFVSNIKLIGLDTRDAKIRLEYNEVPYVGKNTDRMFATLVFENKITIKKQKEIILRFNELLTHYRHKYKSMFLTNYRDFGRKRINFDLVYSIVSYLRGSAPSTP